MPPHENELIIRPVEDDDWPDLWPLLRDVFREGTTHPVLTEISEEEARKYWIDLPKATYVAYLGQTAVGSYHLKPNQPGLGGHVCNAGYVVDRTFRRQGIGRALCRHSQEEAVKLGFLAMQFNLVVETNLPSLNLWKSEGFTEIGRLPKAFRHKELGFVDAYIFYKCIGEKTEV